MIRLLRRRMFNRNVLVVFLIFGVTWWIYVKYSRYKTHQELFDIRLNNDHIEDGESYPGDISHIRKVIEVKVNAMDKHADYLPDINHIPKNLQKDLLKTHEPNKIDKLKKLLKGNPLSRDVEFEEDFLRAYITSNNHNINDAFTKIINFLILRIEHDELFHNISFDFTQNPAYRFITLLPHRNKDGSVILLFEVGKWNPDVVPLVHLKRLLFMVHMQELRNPLTQANGFSTIYDLKDIGFKHLQLASPQNIRLLNHVAFDVLPVVFAGIHLVNVNFFANLLMPLIRQLLPTYIEKVFYVHSSAEELLKFFPVSTMAAQYGGHLTEFYAADWMKLANEQNDNYPPGGQKNVF